MGEREVRVGLDFLWMLHPTFQEAGPFPFRFDVLPMDWRCFWGLFNGEPSCWPRCVFWTASSVVRVTFFLLIRSRYNWTICFLPYGSSQLGNCARKLLVKSCLIFGMGSGTSYYYECLGVLVYTPRQDPQSASSVFACGHESSFVKFRRRIFSVEPSRKLIWRCNRYPVWDGLLMSRIVCWCKNGITG